jgi:2-methylcitrate dehydratase PrpD
VTVVHESYLENATRDLAAFSSQLSFEQLPSEIVEHSKFLILDAIGCALYGSTLPWTRIVADMVREEGASGVSSVIGLGFKSSPSNAVLVNSTACHAYELDDIHKLAMFHPGSMAIPTALALAELEGGRSGRDLITAIAAGYEVSLRAGVAAGMPLFFRGYHPQGALGVFTAGATAARVLNLSSEQTLHALGIAGTQAAGLMAAQEGAMVKRFHSGRSCQSGVYAALLARKGLTGIVDVLEVGYGGFLSTVSGDPKPEHLLAGLGSVWELGNVGFKPYACVTSIHTSLDGLRGLMNENALAWDQIDKLEVGLSPMTHVHCAWEYKAQGTTAAQMNLFFGLGAVAVDGEAFIAQYKPERLNDPKILEVINRTIATVDSGIEAMGATGRHAMRMKLSTKDGRSFETYIEHRRGSPENPLSWRELERKFQLLAKECIDDGRAARIVEMVQSFDKLDSVDQLMSELLPQTNV